MDYEKRFGIHRDEEAKVLTGKETAATLQMQKITIETACRKKIHFFALSKRLCGAK
jgi:hypothetical protein